MTQPASGPRPLSFPKAARLRKRSEFLAVKGRGRSFADGPLAASWAPRAPEPTRAPGGTAPAVARVGLAVSSKVGDSVTRSLIKRRLREAVRHELAALPAVDLVLVARGSARAATVEQLRGWLRRAAARMQREGL